MGCPSAPPAVRAGSAMLSPTDYDSLEIQQQYSDVNNRWDDGDDWEHEGSSARRFERSRIKALAGTGPGGGTRVCKGGWVHWCVRGWARKGVECAKGSVSVREEVCACAK